MILVDFNQVVISNFMAQVGSHKTMPLDEGMLRHMILNTIRSFRQKFAGDYGELVICCDSRKYWRKEIFPYYKANRKKDREASGVDWQTMFNTLTLVREELANHFPYKTIMVDGAEADDIIGTLIHERHDQFEKILILSSDKDFMQLQIHNNVKQYSPVHKKFIRTADPKTFLKEHIIKGDRGDGIPNVMSNDSVFVSSGRQKPLRKNIMEKILEANMETPQLSDLNENVIRNWQRNQKLVDLSYIPSEIKDQILEAYDQSQSNPRSGLLNYFVKHKLKNLTEHIGDF